MIEVTNTALRLGNVFDNYDWGKWTLASALPAEALDESALGALGYFHLVGDQQKQGWEPCQTVCIIGALMIDCGAYEIDFGGKYDAEKKYYDHKYLPTPFSRFMRVMREYTILYAEQYFLDRWIEHYDKEFWQNIPAERSYWMNLEVWNDDIDTNFGDVSAFLGEFGTDSQYKILSGLLKYQDSFELRDLHRQANFIGDFDETFKEKRVDILNQIFNMSVPVVT
jgi:hypothetical protein